MLWCWCRAIVITAPVRFDQQPVPSGIDNVLIRAAGLEHLKTHRLWGPDETDLWVRPGAARSTPGPLRASVARLPLRVSRSQLRLPVPSRRRFRQDVLLDRLSLITEGTC